MPSKARLSLVIAALVLTSVPAAGSIVEIIDATGDGTHALAGPIDVAVGAGGDVYVVGLLSQNAFRITPSHVITQIIDAAGDGAGHPLTTPAGIAVDGADNVYVTGADSDNAFKITPGGVVSQIIDAAGDGAGHPLDNAVGVAVDANDNVFITGADSNNVFRITPGGAISQIIDGPGDGTGHSLAGPNSVAVDGSGNVYVSGVTSNNAFKITPGGVITQIIDATGDGAGKTLLMPSRIAADAAGNVYVAVTGTDNAFAITPGGTITEIIDVSGDGQSQASELRDTMGIAPDAAGNVYVVGMSRDDMFKVVPGVSITEVVDGSGDGAGNPLDQPMRVSIGSDGRIYVAGYLSDNVFLLGQPFPTICPPIPATTCHAPLVPGRSALLLKDRSPDERDQLSWKWAGDATAKGEFGTPPTTTDYAFCLYDPTALLAAATVPAGGECPLKPCWVTDPRGFQYKDKKLTPDGVRQIVLREGLIAGKAKVQVKGQGLPLPMPELPIVNLPLTVQLHNGRGECWQAVYTTPIKNDDGQFRARSD